MLKETIEFALAEFTTVGAEKHKARAKTVLDAFMGFKSNLMRSTSSAVQTSLAGSSFLMCSSFLVLVEVFLEC